MVPKILITTSSFNLNDNPHLSAIKNEGFEIVCNPYGRRLSEEEVTGLLKKNVVGMIAGVEPLTCNALKSACDLKVISRCGIGMDNVDVETARELGILVSNTPDGPVCAVAELAISLMLSVLRRVSEADRNIRGGDWKPLMGGLLSAQKVGVIGYGRIGRKVSQLLRAFGAEVMMYDSQQVTPDKRIKACSLDDLLSNSDIVTLHLPCDSSTKHVINRDRISIMKPGAILINTARGGLVDEDALLEALKSGHLSGSGLDVFSEEPYTGPLRTMPQVVLTAHMGSYAREARRQMELDVSRNLVQGLISKGFLKESVVRIDEGGLE